MKRYFLFIAVLVVAVFCTPTVLAQQIDETNYVFGFRPVENMEADIKLAYADDFDINLLTVVIHFPNSQTVLFGKDGLTVQTLWPYTIFIDGRKVKCRHFYAPPHPKLADKEKLPDCFYQTVGNKTIEELFPSKPKAQPLPEKDHERPWEQKNQSFEI